MPTAIEERKTVTVLFADLRGSTGLISGHDPEQAIELLELAIGVMRESVHRFGGVVTRIMGDGLMALFGAPHAQEQHASFACRAALAMSGAVRGLSTRWVASTPAAAASNPEILLRIGLHSGEVVFRPVRNDFVEDWDASGEVVAIAARMEQMAQPGEVWATATTLHLVRGGIIAHSLGARPVKGLKQPVEIFRLDGVDQWRSRLQISAERHGLSTFIARGPELAILGDALTHARAGEGRVVALVADAGCGKSRLSREFAASPAAADCLVLAGDCTPFAGTRTGYLPLLEICRSCFGVLESDDPATLRARILAKLEPLGDGIAAILPALLALYDVADSTEAAAWNKLEADDRRRRIIEALLTVMRYEAGDRTLIVIMEDLHWVDAESETLLATLMQELPDLRVLLLVTYRPEYNPAWVGQGHLIRIDVRPLNSRDAFKLSQSLLGGTRMTAPLARLLVKRTSGNPLFLEETVAELSEQGVLEGKRGAYRFSSGRQADDALRIPTTVRTVLAARIDRLPAEDKLVLETAAIVGPEFHPMVLAEAAGITGAAALAALDRLRAAGFVQEAPSVDVASFAFRHIMVQEAAYAGILHTRRRDMHARVMAAIERLFPDRLAEQAEVLTRHAMLGEVWNSVVTHASRAAGRAAARDANAQAVAFYEDALAAVERLPKDEPATRNWAVHLRFAARAPLFRLGQIDRTLKLMREAEPLVECLGDTARLGQLAIFISHLSWLAGDHASALAQAERARAIGADSGDHALAARADFQIGLGLLGQGSLRPAADFMTATAERALMPEVADRYGLDAPLAVVALGYRARALVDLGELEAARDAVDACAALSVQVDRPFTSIFAAVAAGYLSLAEGDSEDAIARLKEAVAHCHQADTALMLPVATGFLGSAYVAAGSISEGIRQLRSAIAEADRIGFRFLQPQRVAMLAAGLLAGGRLGEAGRTAARAAMLADRQGERGAAVAALLVRAQVMQANGRRQQAVMLAVEAERGARELGMLPLVKRAAACVAELSLSG